MASPPIDLRIVEAANLGNLNVVTSLIEEGVDVSVHDDWALRCAARAGKLNVVKKLVEAGASPCAMDSMAAKWATLEGHTEMICWLKDQGAQLRLAWLVEATKESAWNESVVELLLKYGRDSPTEPSWFAEATRKYAWNESIVDRFLELERETQIKPTEASAVCLQALRTGHKGMYLLLWHHGVRARPTEIAEYIADRYFNVPINWSDFSPDIFSVFAQGAYQLLKFHSEDEQRSILDAINQYSQEMSKRLGDKISSRHIAAGAWATSHIHNLPADWSAAMKRLAEQNIEYEERIAFQRENYDPSVW